MSGHSDPSTNELADALAQFDRVAANLEKLDRIWGRIADETPGGAVFGLDTPELEDLVRTYEHLAATLPAIDGFRLTTWPHSQDAIAQMRLEAWELGEVEIATAVERAITEPGRELGEYRFRFNRARRQMVRRRVREVVEEVDRLLGTVTTARREAAWSAGDNWDTLEALVSELDRLVGSNVPGDARWGQLRRHLFFAEPTDLRDIVKLDWPSVRQEVQNNMYQDDEPIPIDVDDLGELARANPTGRVSSKIDWSLIIPEDFERLIYELVVQTPGYENVNWLMKTEAPDRGRDIEAYRVVDDPLSGVGRDRVIFQCKHWQARSVGIPDLVTCIETVALWEPPHVDHVVVATTGRFTQDAVAWREKRQLERSRPSVSLWADSHLETLLARRPALVAQYGLR